MFEDVEECCLKMNNDVNLSSHRSSLLSKIILSKPTDCDDAKPGRRNLTTFLEKPGFVEAGNRGTEDAGGDHPK